MSYPDIIDTLREPSKRIEVMAGQKLRYLIPITDSVSGLRQREFVLIEPGAEVEVIGLFLGQADDHLDIKIKTVHAAPNTKGRINFRSVLSGRAQFDFHGLIRINPGAQNSDDFLEQRSILLSPEAKATTIPALEIEANDVKASHAATAGPVDPEQKFYLMARGLTESQAEGIIMAGFIRPIIKALTGTPLYNQIVHQVADRFHISYDLIDGN